MVFDYYGRRRKVDSNLGYSTYDCAAVTERSVHIICSRCCVFSCLIGFESTLNNRSRYSTNSTPGQLVTESSRTLVKSSLRHLVTLSSL